MNTNNIKSVKMQYNGQIKRSQLPQTFPELKLILSKAFGLNLENTGTANLFNISYTDDENDTVLISDEFDYTHAKLFMDKQNIECLKVNIEKQENIEQVRTESNNFEMINGPIKCEDKIEFPLNQKPIEEDIIVQSINGMRLSSDLAKSEVFSNANFVNESNEEECKDFVKNMAEKSEQKEQEKIQDILEIKTEEPKVQSTENKNKSKCCKKKNNKCKENIDQLKKNIVNNCKAIKDKFVSEAHKIGKTAKIIAKKVISEVKQNFPKAESDLIPNKDMETFKSQVRQKLRNTINYQWENSKLQIMKKVFEESDRQVEELFKEIESQKKSFASSSVVHNNVRCDGCNKKPLTGNRYKCSICNNFDFCEECEEKFQHLHNHPFIKIRKPELSPIQIISIVNEENPDADYEINEVTKVKDTFDYYVNKAVDIKNDIEKKFHENLKKVISLNYPVNSDQIFELFGARQQGEVLKNSTEEKVDLTMLPSSACLTENLNIEVVNNDHEVRKAIKLINNGKVAWPKPCYLACIKTESAIQGKNNAIKVRVEPGKEINVEVCLDLKDIKKEGEYVSVWQLQNEKKEGFGDKITLKVKANFNNDIVINQEFVQIPKDVFSKSEKVDANQIKIMTVADHLKRESQPPQSNFQQIANQMKNEFYLQGIEDRKILYAVVMADGNIEVALDHLFNRSSVCDYHPKHHN